MKLDKIRLEDRVYYYLRKISELDVIIEGNGYDYFDIYIDDVLGIVVSEDVLTSLIRNGIRVIDTRDAIYNGMKIVEYELDTSNADIVVDGKERLRSRYINIIKEHVLPVVNMPISCHVVHIGISPSRDDDRFHIHFWATPWEGLEDGRDVPDTIFGIKVPCTDPPSYVYSGNGINIDDRGHSVAELIGNNLYIHHDITHNNTDTEMELLQEICIRAMLAYRGDLDALRNRDNDRVSELRNVSRKAISRLIGNSYRRAAKKVADRILDDSREVSHLNASIVERTRSIYANMDILKVMEERLASKKRNKYAGIYDELLSLEHVEDVIVDSGIISIMTDTINAVNPDTMKIHTIGKMKIDISLVNSSIKFTNLTHYGSVGLHAPHTHGNGNACFGTMQSRINDMLIAGDIVGLAKATIEFLQIVNPDDSFGARITRFPIDEEATREVLGSDRS